MALVGFRPANRIAVDHQAGHGHDEGGVRDRKDGDLAVFGLIGVAAALGTRGKRHNGDRAGPCQTRDGELQGLTSCKGHLSLLSWVYRLLSPASRFSAHMPGASTVSLMKFLRSGAPHGSGMQP